MTKIKGKSKGNHSLFCTLWTSSFKGLGLTPHCEDLGGNRGVEWFNAFFSASKFVSGLRMHPERSTDYEYLRTRLAVGEN